MRKFLPLVMLSLILLSSFTGSKPADDIIGTWLVGSGKARVEIFRKGEKYFGKISWLKEPKNADGTYKKDANNPDKSLRERNIIGVEMLQGFVYEGDWEWEDGEIYDPESGKTYSCVITMKDKNTLDVRGYIGFSWMGRSDTWTRVN